jgi:hypothetical protein
MNKYIKQFLNQAIIIGPVCIFIGISTESILVGSIKFVAFSLAFFADDIFNPVRFYDWCKKKEKQSKKYMRKNVSKKSKQRRKSRKK